MFDIDLQRFIAEYLKNFDPRVAILVAGYKGQDLAKDGNKLIQEPGVQNEILRVIEARAQVPNACARLCRPERSACFICHPERSRGILP